MAVIWLGGKGRHFCVIHNRVVAVGMPIATTLINDSLVMTYHPFTLWLLKTMLWLLGIAALVPGIELMIDPSGKLVQFPEGYLDGAPFSNYFIPGLLLTVFIGFGALGAGYALWKKPSSKWLQQLNPFRQWHWAWAAALSSGIALMVWITVQVMMVPYFILQPILFTWGALIALLCFSPGVRRFYLLEQHFSG